MNIFYVILFIFFSFSAVSTPNAEEQRERDILEVQAEDARRTSGKGPMLLSDDRVDDFERQRFWVDTMNADSPKSDLPIDMNIPSDPKSQFERFEELQKLITEKKVRNTNGGMKVAEDVLQRESEFLTSHSLYLLQRSAAGGYPLAQLTLARVYFQGEYNIQQDVDKAMDILNRVSGKEHIFSEREIRFFNALLDMMTKPVGSPSLCSSGFRS